MANTQILEEHVNIITRVKEASSLDTINVTKVSELDVYAHLEHLSRLFSHICSLVWLEGLNSMTCSSTLKGLATLNDLRSCYINSCFCYI